MAQEFLSRTGYRPVQTADLTSASISDFAEAAQDNVAAILTDTSSIDFTYDDGAPTITADLTLTGVAAGTYGTPTTVASFTVDLQGRITFVEDIEIDDYLSGLYFIGSSETKRIPQYKQMVVFSEIQIDGQLLVDGQFFVEA